MSAQKGELPWALVTLNSSLRVYILVKFVLSKLRALRMVFETNTNKKNLIFSAGEQKTGFFSIFKDFAINCELLYAKKYQYNKHARI